MPERIVLHVDMDAFYASVEQRENPDYHGRPVVVGADPKGGKGRGVVAGCSYEARKFGIRSAMPISRAFRLCPDAVFVRPRFSLYGKVSDDVMNLLDKFSNSFEQVGIDEAFLDISSVAKDYAEAENLGREIKQTVREKERLSCSIGIAPNKAVAKIASDYQKPDGLTVVPPGRVSEFLAPLPVRKIIGVGPKTEDALRKIGISTIGQLASQPRGVMSEMFGKYGLRLWELANGMDDSEVRPWEGMKSVSSETTFEEDTRDYTKIEAALDELIDDVYDRTVSSRYEFRTVGIKIRFEGFETFTRAKSHHDYTTEKALMRQYARELLQEFKFDRRKVRLVGFRVSNLRGLDASQVKLAAWSGGQA
jgi:DNA polymerase IV (DinB-like DNA polymerase)